MDPHSEHENDDIDFFSQSLRFEAAPSGGSGHGSGRFTGLDLNSVSFSNLLRSLSNAGNVDETPRGLHGHIGGENEANRRGAGGGARGRGAVGSGRGRGGRGHGAAGVEGVGRGAAGVEGGFEVGGRGRGGRGAAGVGTRGVGAARPPIPPSSLPYRAPRPAIGQSSAGDSSEYTGNNSMPSGAYEVPPSYWNEQEADDDVQVNDATNEQDFDKADWTNSENTAAFCIICVEEITAGNRSNGFMTGRGYKNIAIKFQRLRGLRHSKTQLKNKWESLKRFYSFWLWCNKQTGLGRTPNGGIAAGDNFWKTHTKGHAEWRRLKLGPPENLAELEIMFEHTDVDGSTSCVPGEHMDDEGDAGEEREDDADGSPMSVSNMKRASSNTTTVTSPRKKIKSPMVKIMKGIWEDMKETNAAAQKALHEKAMQAEYSKDSITKCMSLAVESGASEGSAEHFMACKLFVKEEHRQVFLTINTNAGRLAFLRRWCRVKKVE